MKKRDKSKAYKIGFIPEIMPRRKQKYTYPGLTKEKLEATIKEVFASAPPIDPNWHDAWISSQPRTPTESFRFEIMDIGSEREVDKRELVKGHKLKLTL